MTRQRRRRSLFNWLYPGLRIKRWLLLMAVGVAMMGLGIAYLLREAYLSYTFPGFFYYLTLQFIPRYVRGALFMGASLGAIALALWQLNRSLLSVFLRPGQEAGIVSAIYNHYVLRRGPKTVAIGGGTGLSWLLRGLKQHTSNLTAIVTVADDGGSSGRLRRELGILAPGDVRKCIAALADVEPLMAKLFEYRFSEGTGLNGHSFGNLFIAAMSGVTGNIEEAIRETSRVLAVRGQILPSTLADVTLYARTHDQETIYGESNITARGGRIRDVHIDPADAAAYPEALDAILAADVIVVGPGSLYTSVIPNFLVPDIRKAMAASRALKLFVCNVATQRGETERYSVGDHIEALERHIGRGVFHAVLANSNIRGPLPAEWHSEPVLPDATPLSGARLVLADVVSEENRYRHDPAKLADAVLRLYHDREARTLQADRPQVAAV